MYVALEMQLVEFLLHLFSHYFILIQATPNGTFGHTKFATLDWCLYIHFVHSSPKRENSLLFEVGVKYEMLFVIQYADKHVITIRKTWYTMCRQSCQCTSIHILNRKNPNMTSQIWRKALSDSFHIVQCFPPLYLVCVSDGSCFHACDITFSLSGLIIWCCLSRVNIKPAWWWGSTCPKPKYRELADDGLKT